LKKEQVLRRKSLKFNKLFSQKIKKDLGENIKALTFALPIKKGDKK